MSASKPHSDLPPVSYEALAENNRHTHANLNACIEARQRLEEQVEASLYEGHSAEHWHGEYIAACKSLRKRVHQGAEAVRRERGLREQLGTLQRDYDLAVGWLDQYEHWASSMPDAGLTDADPRRAWYFRRPQYPDFPAMVPYPASMPVKRQTSWGERYEGDEPPRVTNDRAQDSS